MNSADDSRREERQGWEDIGRAAEDFARRVARDASRFAERLQEHTTDFACDVRREWRRGHHRHHRRRDFACGRASADDVRRVFDDIRGVLAGVLDGIDELIGRVFPADGDEAEGGAAWERIVTNRDASCSACGRAIAVGEEVYARRSADVMEYRCPGCGAEEPSHPEG
jgi:predicted RNA-binding Zn-ribbon protein involved in translation (DUF1610 family)